MPTRSEFATWLKVEVWISLVFVGLLALASLTRFGIEVGSEYVDGVRPLLPYVLGGWCLVVLASIWYVGQLAEA